MSRRILIEVAPNKLTVTVTTGDGTTLETFEAEDEIETLEQQVAAIVRDTIRAVTA